MGFFSWQTADTKESIGNIHSSKPSGVVYLFQPNGKPSIKGSAYSGYGEIGGVDVYEWLAETNFGVANRSIGIMADCGSFYSDAKHYYFCSIHLERPDFDQIKHMLDPSKTPVFFSDYGSIIPETDMNMNDMVDKKLVSKESLQVKYSLKFSFDHTAVYEKLPASESCPNQGYFF